MKLIAWDTSSKTGALVAIEWDPMLASNGEPFRIVSEWKLNVNAAQHSERLLWAIHQMLEACTWKLAEIDIFGVGVGPGSFTGLRIGITTARTLAHTTKKPLVGVSSLAALARPVALHFAAQTHRTVVIATTDAAKGELFALLGAAKSLVDCVVMSDGDRPGLWKRGVAEEVASPEALLKTALKKLAEGKSPEQARWIGVGEGRNRHAKFWKKLPPGKEAGIALPGIHSVQGRYLGSLVWEAYQAGLARPPLDVYPRYLRVSDAERKLRAGLLPAGPTRGNA